MRKYLFVMGMEGVPWGGSELLWSSAAEKLARRGNEVRVSAKDWSEPVPQIEKLRAASCRIFLRDDRLPPFFTRQMRRLSRAPDYRLTHVRTAGEGVDLVVISQGANDDALVLIEAVRDAGYKYAIVSQSAMAHAWPSDDFAARLGKVYDQAAAAYFVSRANVELSRRMIFSPLRNAKVVRNPFNVRYDVKLPWPGDSANELELACVGRLDVISKAQDVLLQVLALPHWRGRKVHVSFFGTGPHERALHRIAGDLKLTNVRFAGEVADIESVWSQHHASVLPSRYEGMPLVVVEAMLCGRPCIVTKVGGNAELVQDGMNGFLAKAATVELVDEAMNRAWENRRRLKEMGQAAARDVREWVSPDPGEDFANELESLVNGMKAQ